jgi:hypothetical protein
MEQVQLVLGTGRKRLVEFVDISVYAPNTVGLEVAEEILRQFDFLRPDTEELCLLVRGFLLRRTSEKGLHAVQGRRNC